MTNARADSLKAAIYDRTSIARGHPENQAQALRDFATTKGYDVVAEFTDKTSAGPQGEQDQYNAMMHAARRRDFDVLLFWSWDRITRRGAEVQYHIMNEWTRMGIVWVSLQEPYLSSSSDPNVRETMAGIIATIAKQERQRQSERMKAWSDRKHRDGEWVTRKGVKDKKPRKRRWWKKPAQL